MSGHGRRAASGDAGGLPSAAMTSRATAVLWVPPGITDEHRALLPAAVEVRELPGPEGALPDTLGQADMLVPHIRRRRLREVLPRLEGLSVIQTLSAGVDRYLDLVPSGVTLCDAAGVHDLAVSEWVLAAILAMQRDMPLYVRQQREHRWSPAPRMARELEGSRALIVGHGSIGRAVARRLLAFGVEVRGVARTAREGVDAIERLPELLAEADIVVILLPLTPRTTGMVDARFVAGMKPGALLVNAGRGQFADMEAIADAVREGRIRAALDVTDPEPLPDSHPLWEAPGALITPHVAGTSEHFMTRAWQLVADQLGRFMAGEPLRNVVTDGY